MPIDLDLASLARVLPPAVDHPGHPDQSTHGRKRKKTEEKSDDDGRGAGGTESSPSVGQRFANGMHNDNAIRAAFDYHDEQTGMTAKVVRVFNSPYGQQDAVQVNIEIHDRDGKLVGAGGRIISADGTTVNHANLHLDEKVQGQGFATRFNANAEATYRANGVERITLTTDEIGGYAWARAGYNFRRDGERREFQNKFRLRADTDPNLSPAVRDQMRQVANRPGVTPAELAMVGYAKGAKTWPGKQMMLDQMWDGERFLTPTAQNSVHVHVFNAVDRNEVLDLIAEAYVAWATEYADQVPYNEDDAAGYTNYAVHHADVSASPDIDDILNQQISDYLATLPDDGNESEAEGGTMNARVNLDRVHALAEAARVRANPAPTQPSADGRRWYWIENKRPAVADVYLYDMIGEWGVTAQEFVNELRDIKESGIDLHVNCEGGEVFDGLAIYETLRRHPATVTAYVDGIAASSASVIVQAAKRIVMAPRARMMIHDAHGIVFGNARDMREMATLLDDLSDTIADIYAERAGGTRASWRAAMRAGSGGPDGTWYAARAAVAAKLADEINDDTPAVEASWTTAPTQRPAFASSEPSFDPVAFGRAFLDTLTNIETPPEELKIPTGESLRSLAE